MSFRLPRGPKLITLFHDAKSPSSQRVLKVLQSSLNVEQNDGKNNDDDYNGKSRVKVYLEEAASSSISKGEPLFELEIVDRSRATSDQWKTIASYLQQNKSEKMKEIKQSAIERLKDESGPILIDWDDGLTALTEEEVKNLLQKLMGDKISTTQDQRGGQTCQIL